MITSNSTGETVRVPGRLEFDANAIDWDLGAVKPVSWEQFWKNYNRDLSLNNDEMLRRFADGLRTVTVRAKADRKTTKPPGEEMARATLEIVKLSSLEDGWGWLEEACAQLGDPKDQRMYERYDDGYRCWWLWEVEGVGRHIIIEQHPGRWEVKAACNRIGLPDTSWLSTKEPTSDDVSNVMAASRFFTPNPEEE
jgi:hypothetical protein